jgi:23S rRNA (adenine2503-C2)-methyltransferase
MDTHLPLIYDLALVEIEKLMSSWDEPRYRAKQLWQGLYQKLWQKPEEFTNLPGQLRNRLGIEFNFVPLTPIDKLDSKDRQTQKILFRLADGQQIETVKMCYERGVTLCISTQVGCAMGCVFCATGQMGFKRHLTVGEIVCQVLYFARELAANGERVANVVIMGMGEPFHNYDATLKAIDILNHPEGYKLGERRFTISTVGLIPMIQKFSAEKRQVNLAISLHAATDEMRSSLLPINKKYPLDDLLKVCREYVEQTGRRITFEWALIKNLNDTPVSARQLASRLRGLSCHVNVIPLNPTGSYSGQATTRERAQLFKEELEKAGIPCTIRLRRGIDIKAGCGQLASQHR